MSSPTSSTTEPTQCEVCAERLTSCVTERTAAQVERIETQKRLAAIEDIPTWSTGMGVALMLSGTALSIWGALRAPDPARPYRPDWPLVGAGAAAALAGGVILLRW